MPKLMTMDELIAKCGEGDPLYDEAEQLEPDLDEEVLIIRGYDNDKGYADDLKITINDNSLTLHYKETDKTVWQLACTTCEDCTDPFGCIHTTAYEL